MVRFQFFIVCLVLIAGCKKGYDPAEHLTAEEEYDQVWKIIRYLAKPPENLTFKERFYKGYDKYYQEQTSLHRLDAYFVDKEGTHYFLVSRRAPSITDKRVATGGKLTQNADGSIATYEEVFRTWKMPDSILIRKSLMLFDLMVKGEPLDPYLTKNSWPEEYIEFPDDRTYYDVNDRTWKGRPME
jgi:hypothetical protein